MIQIIYGKNGLERSSNFWFNNMGLSPGELICGLLQALVLRWAYLGVGWGGGGGEGADVSAGVLICGILRYLLCCYIEIRCYLYEYIVYVKYNTYIQQHNLTRRWLQWQNL